MKDGFIKVASVAPKLRVADCDYNAQQIITAASHAAGLNVNLLVTPELGITGYTCGDLFFQQELLNNAEIAVEKIAAKSSGKKMLVIVGAPLQHKGKLYNCAAVIYNGKLLGIVPKTNLPNYWEFYENRYYTSWEGATQEFSSPSGKFSGVPIGTDIIFQCKDLPLFNLAVEICEDLWVPCPPSIRHTSAGATIVANLSAGNETIGKAAYRRELVRGHSARTNCGYVYSNAGRDESTTDMVFSGHNIIAENGIILAETPLFSEGIACSEIDVVKLAHDRKRQNTYPAAAVYDYKTILFDMDVKETELNRFYSPTPFVPETPIEKAENCETAFLILTNGLRKRLEHIKAEKVVIGVSGGLDSTLALLIIARTFRMTNRPLNNIIAISMPGFGTTEQTKTNAEKLCRLIGVTYKTIDITPSVREHFNDIHHLETERNNVYENAQARMRTVILMDIANKYNTIVIGTGDLSEIALGWNTYNGDHMSMYAVNASVPKTLIAPLLEYEATRNPALEKVLKSVIDTPVSPELLPAEDGEISQKTEQLVGPYMLNDFFLYYIVRWGCSPKKVYRLACHAFKEIFSSEEILKWLKSFYKRFSASQFKRNCMPDGPKIGTISMSPRSDWRMPSDADMSQWIAQLDSIKIDSETKE